MEKNHLNNAHAFSIKPLTLKIFLFQKTSRYIQISKLVRFILSQMSPNEVSHFFDLNNFILYHSTRIETPLYLFCLYIVETVIGTKLLIIW